jgi:hypothetical protein
LISSKKISVRVFALAGALSFLIIQLNIYFAWTSHVGAAAGRGFFSGGSSTPLRSFLVSEVNDFVKIQLGIPALSSFFTNLASSRSVPSTAFLGGGGGFHGGGFFGGGGFPFFGSPNSLAMKYLIDTEVILFTFAVFVISLSLFQKRGIGVALLRAFEITSLTILPLGLEIFFFDRFELNIHASDIQVLAGTAWFTNADVLFLSSAILGGTLLVEVMRYKNRKSDTGAINQVTDFQHGQSSKSGQGGIQRQHTGSPVADPLGRPSPTHWVARPPPPLCHGWVSSAAGVARVPERPPSPDHQAGPDAEEQRALASS